MCTSLQISPFMKQCFVTASVDFSTVCYGCTLGFPAVLLPQLRDPLSNIKLTEEGESWIASICALGMLCGYFLTPPIMGRLGRKTAHCFVSVMFLIGWIIVVYATDAQALFIARVCHGIAGGIVITLATVLVGECTSPKNRGAFLTTTTLSQSTGILLVHFLGSILSWQKTALICLIFPIASFIICMYIPESPSWFLARGQYDRFKKTFRWFRGDDDEEELTSMLEAKSKAYDAQAVRTRKIKNYFGYLTKVLVKKEFYKPIIIVIHSNNMLQFAGGTLLITYATTIIGYMMGTTANVHLWTVFMDITRIIPNIIAVYVIHKFNRRTLMFLSGTFCILCNAVIVFYLYGKSIGWFQQSSWIPVIFLGMELFANGIGIVPIRNVIAGELFPLKYRSIGGSITFAIASIIMFIVLKTFPALVENIQIHGAYAVYTAILMYSLVVIMLMQPETKGRTLQQIEDNFKGKQRDQTDITAKIISPQTRP